MAYIYILENKNTNRIIDVRMNPERFRVVGINEKIVRRYVPEQEQINMYQRYKRAARRGKVLRSPTQ